MLIRSQDKKRQYNYELFICVYARSDGKIIGNYKEYDYVIAEYSTEAKAIKVLDMIQACYTAYKNRATGSYDYTNCCVFQMQQDEEV